MRRCLVLCFVALSTLLVFSGCQKKTVKSQTKAAASDKTSVKEPASAAQLGSVDFPDGVLGFGGTASLSAFTKGLSDIVSHFNPTMGASLGQQIEIVLQSRVLRVMNLDWLDRDRSVYFVVANPQGGDKVLSLVFPVKDPKALQAALPPGKKEDKALGATTYSALDKTMYVSMLDSRWAMFATDPTALKRTKEFANKLTAYKFRGLLDAQISVPRLSALVLPFLQAMEGRMKQAQQPKLKGIAKVLDQELTMYRALLAQGKTARIQVSYEGGNIRLTASFQARPGTRIARFASESRKYRLKLYKKLPKDGWLVYAANIDPRLFQGWTSIAVTSWDSILGFSPGEKKKLQDLLERMEKLQGGDQATYVGMAGQFPLEIVSLQSTSDGDELAKVMSDVVALVLPRLGKKLLEGRDEKTSKELASLDFSSLDKLVASLKPILKGEGVDLKIEDAKAGGLEGRLLTLKVQEKALKQMDDQDAKKLLGSVGSQVGLVVAHDRHTYAFALGKDPLGLLKGLGQNAGESQIDEILARAHGNVFAAGYLSLTRVAKIIANLDPSLRAWVPGLDTTKEDAKAVVTAGSLDDTSVYVSLEVTLRPLGQLLGLGRAAGPTPAPAGH